MKKIYLILPILAGILSGSTGVFVRTLTGNGIDATTLLFLRFSVGILVMIVTILLTDKNQFKIKLSDIKLFIIPAICILGLNLCYNEAINNINLSLAAVLMSSAPVFAIIFAYALIGERITSKKIISIIFVIIGCALTTGLLEGNAFNVNVIGIIEGVVSALFLAIYTVSSKIYLKEGYHTNTILLYTIILISIILIPFTNFNQITAYVTSNITFNIIFLILHSTLSFALPYILLTLSLNYIDVGIASIFTSASEPLTALFIGICFYGEIPTVLMVAGMVLTILALTNIFVKLDDLKIDVQNYIDKVI